MRHFLGASLAACDASLAMFGTCQNSPGTQSSSLLSSPLSSLSFRSHPFPVLVKHSPTDQFSTWPYVVGNPPIVLGTLLCTSLMLFPLSTTIATAPVLGSPYSVFTVEASIRVT